ncbi:DUF421 domain-containing protein [Halobacillus litoralis]|uniref:DUF421 domain-containing protein n=1 Tax=Halobacillus litoralis TaxID=45668 RepID=UPI001F3D79A6|nr:DUF421 domain-containing protein [Halobacillus litoralis]
MELWKDLFVVIIRIVTILPLMLGVGIFMGKRSIGELPVFDFLVVLVLGSVVGADIADPDIDHIHTVAAIIVIALLQKFIVTVKLKNRKLGKMLTFEPTIVVYKGQMVEKNLYQIRYSIDNITQMLREQQVFDLTQVELGIVEANGSLSVKLLPDKEPPAREDFSLSVRGGGYDVPIILDGKLQPDILQKMGRDRAWLEEALGNHRVTDVFYGALTSEGSFHYSLKGHLPDNIPPLSH